MKIKLLFFILTIGLLNSVYGQQTIVKPTNKISSSFAIFVDKTTYNECKTEIESYKNILEAEGLSTFILYADWESPEHVKFFINKYYIEENLEGAVFIGDIPVPMIRNAHHLTSAFKMDEKEHPIFQSSVPSDRFYDDLNLKFDFIKRDSVHSNLFYYNLSSTSPQRISCSIYSGRIKQGLDGEEGYNLLRKYLKKVVAERAKENTLNRIVSYGGEGSCSNSLCAWKDELITMKEQIPASFNDADGAKFYFHSMHKDIKDVLINEMRRDDVDLMMFHEHGTVDNQYITAFPDAEMKSERHTSGKMDIRYRLRRAKDRDLNIDSVKLELIKEFGIDSSWFVGTFDRAIIEQDSINDAKNRISLDEISAIAPNPKFVIFDACYNGDFRHKRFVANEYIFSSGNTIACFANSVNVLQDKSATDLIGMLACGYRLGEWSKNINILESHIIGDPTFRFKPYMKLPKIKLKHKEIKYWKAVISHNLPADLQSLALYKLFELEYDDMSNLLLKIFKGSPHYTQRLQCMHLLAHYNDENYIELLKLALDDPFEFIRRKACYYVGKVGRSDLIPHLLTAYMNDHLAKRIAFNVTYSSLDHFNPLLVDSYFDKIIKEYDYIYNKEEFTDKFQKEIDNAASSAKRSYMAIIDSTYYKSDRYRYFMIRILRNKPMSFLVDDLLLTLENAKTPINVKLQLAEILGWYVRSHKRDAIVLACENILATQAEAIDKELSKELTQTIARLKTYMR